MIAAIRRRTIRDIKKRVAPFLHGSGYADRARSDDSLQLTVFDPCICIKGAMLESLQDGIVGFTERGVINDSHGGGLSVIEYSSIPVDDLIRLLMCVTKIKDSRFK